MRERPPPVVVVGGPVTVDVVVRLSHLPAPGETVTGGRFRYAPGGKGDKQAGLVQALLSADAPRFLGP